MAWIDTPTGKRCDRHGEEFDRGDTCVACATDPGPKIAVVTENEHDEELVRREHEIYEISKKCYRVGKELLEGTDRDIHVAAKIIAEGTKAIRAACELREKRAAREHSRWLANEAARLSGLRRGN